jgi:uncharacterized protein (UPF0264 family)
MRLLVSVRDATEAAAALAGGADIVDAKEPLNGALGPVAAEVLHAIAATVAGAAPVSVALGDAGTDDIGLGMQAAVTVGAAFVKVGFAGTQDGHRVSQEVSTLAHLVGSPALILVAYADHESADAPSPDTLIVLGQRLRARGILLDTCDKRGPSLTTLMSERSLRAFVTRAQSAGQLVALAGRLTVDDFDMVLRTGADIVGVRGAACDGGRAGVVSAARVHALRRQIDRAVKAAC